MVFGGGEREKKKDESESVVIFLLCKESSPMRALPVLHAISLACFVLFGIFTILDFVDLYTRVVHVQQIKCTYV